MNLTFIQAVTPNASDAPKRTETVKSSGVDRKQKKSFEEALGAGAKKDNTAASKADDHRAAASAEQKGAKAPEAKPVAAKSDGNTDAPTASAAAVEEEPEAEAAADPALLSMLQQLLGAQDQSAVGEPDSGEDDSALAVSSEDATASGLVPLTWKEKAGLLVQLAAQGNARDQGAGDTVQQLLQQWSGGLDPVAEDALIGRIQQLLQGLNRQGQGNAPKTAEAGTELLQQLVEQAGDVGKKGRPESGSAAPLAAVPSMVHTLAPAADTKALHLSQLAAKQHPFLLSGGGTASAAEEEGKADALETMEPLQVGEEYRNPLLLHQAEQPAQLKNVLAGEAAVEIPAKTFAKDLSAFIAKSFNWTKAAEGAGIKITLNPEYLGHVQVELSLNQGQLSAQFTANTAVGKEMLESQMQQLRASLQSQGIQVEKMAVVQTSLLQSNLSHHQGQQQSFQNSKQNGRQSSGEGYEDLAAIDGAEQAGPLQSPDRIIDYTA